MGSLFMLYHLLPNLCEISPSWSSYLSLSLSLFFLYFTWFSPLLLFLLTCPLLYLLFYSILLSYFLPTSLFDSSGLWPFATVGWPLGENDPNSDLCKILFKQSLFFIYTSVNLCLSISISISIFPAMIHSLSLFLSLFSSLMLSHHLLKIL